MEIKENLPPLFVTGLSEGEGCFSVSFSHRKKMNTNIEVRPSFSISQHRSNLALIMQLRAFFRVGAVRYSARDRTYKYEARAIKDICRAVIPHFRQWPLRGTKQQDFVLFANICQMIHANLHRNVAHLKEIIDMAYRMNQSGTRRYRKEDLLRIISE